jgi:hypothetical protein
MTLTIEVSPETIRRIAGDPEALRRAGEMIDAEFGTDPEDDDKLTAEDIESLKQGVADIDADRVSDAKANSVERREMIRKRRLDRVA